MAELKPRISIDYTENAAIATFTDAKILEERDIRALKETLMPLIGEAEGINLILDFCNVEFLSSAVLGLLIRVSKKVYERDGRLKLCNINPRIYEVFKITRLDEIFDIHPDIDSASKSWAAVD